MSSENAVEVVWTVDRPLEASPHTYLCISICRFSLHCLNKTEWEARVDHYGSDLNAKLFRADADNGPKDIEIDLDFDLLDIQGKLWRKNERERESFTAGSRSEDFLLASTEELEDNRNGLLHNNLDNSNNSLKIIIRLWPVSDPLPQPLTLFARSSAGIQGAFTCSMPRFSDLRNGYTREYTLYARIYDYEAQGLRILLFLHDDKVGVRFSSPSTSDLRPTVLLKSVRIVKCDGIEIAWEGAKNFECDFLSTTLPLCDPDYYLLFVDIQKLIENEVVYLPNDTLTVIFHFTDFGSFSVCNAETYVYGEVSQNLLLSGIEQSAQLSCPVGSSRHLEFLSQNLAELLEQGTFSDFKLTVGTESIPVHKNILSAGSPVLRALIMSPMKESFRNEAEVPDFPIETVRRLVRFLYTGSIPDINPSNAFDLFSIADKYDVLSLRDLCSKVLVSGLCPQTVGPVLSLSDRHADRNLKEQVMTYIIVNQQLVFTSPEWEDLQKNNPALAVDVFQECFVKRSRQEM